MHTPSTGDLSKKFSYSHCELGVWQPCNVQKTLVGFGTSLPLALSAHALEMIPQLWARMIQPSTDTYSLYCT